MSKQKQIAGLIDHTILKPDASRKEVERICEEALEYEFASVCVNPVNVALVAKKLAGSKVNTCAVVGFPLGATPTKVKIFEALQAMEDGAKEIDMVINVGAVKDGDYAAVKQDITELTLACKQKNSAVCVKVIIENCLLTQQEKEAVISLCLDTGADFVKTSTGFSTGGATAEDVRLMKSIVGDKMKIKASGGVRSLEDLEKMVEAGANRIGSSNGVLIVKQVK